MDKLLTAFIHLLAGYSEAALGTIGLLEVVLAFPRRPGEVNKFPAAFLHLHAGSSEVAFRAISAYSTRFQRFQGGPGRWMNFLLRSFTSLEAIYSEAALR